MAVDVAEVGRRRKTFIKRGREMRTILREAVAAKAGEVLQQVVAKLNPVQGDRG